MRLFGTRTEPPETCSPTSPRRDVGINGATAKDGYRIRKKFLGKLHRAALSGDCRKIQWLLLAKGKDINKVDDLNRTALHLACAAGYPDVVSFLVERHCKLDVCDSNHRTPLMKAVQCQQEECVSILLLHGADPNMVDESSSSALHYAAAGGNLRIVERLLESKANMEARDKLGLTPLLLAVKNHHEAMVDLFLKNGANVNAKDNSKRTALMMAISNKFNPTSLVQLILQYDVDLSCEDDFGWTIRDYVRISSVRGHQELVLQYVKTKANELFPEVKTSSPERASDIGFTLGRPALDKNVLSNWECPSTSQKNMTSSRSKLTHFHGNHPCESMALTQRQSRSLGAGPFPLQKDEITIHVTETGSPPGFGFVTPVRITVAQRHLDPPRPLTKEESEKDATQKLDFKGSSEESQKGFDKNHQEQVEEQKNKPQHNEMETLVEDIEEKLPEDKMTEKVNKWAFNVKSLQSNRSEENKIPGEEIPKMIVSSSNGSSVPLHHQSMWFPLGIEEEKQLKADMPLKTIREQIRKKEKLSNKDMERKRSLEPPIEAWAIEPRPGGNNLTQEEEQNNKPRQNEMETLVEYIGKTLPEDEMTVKDNELEFNVWNHHSNKRVENKITETETPKMTVSYSKESSIPVYHQSVFFPMRKEKEKQLRTGMTLKEIREQRKRREKLYRNYMEAMQSWEVDEQSWSREPKPGGNNLTQNLRAVEETPKMTISSSKESSISEYHRFMWFLLRKEEKKQPEADMPLKTIREQIRREEKLSSKEVEKKQSLEVAEQNQAREPRPGGNNLTQVKEEKNKSKHNEMDTPLDGFGEKLPEDNMTVNFNKLPFNVKDHHGNESEENKIPVEETPKLTVPSSKESSIPVLHRFMRFPLKKEKEKQSRAGMPLKTIREQIRRKEKLSSKEVEKKQSLEEPEQSQTTKLRLGENNLTQVEEEENKPQHSEMEMPLDGFGEKLPEDNMTVNFNKLPFNVKDHHGNESEENKIPAEETPKLTVPSSKESSIPVLHRFIRFPLKKEKEKQSRAGMPLKTIREQIRRKEKLSSKEVEKKQSLEVAEQSQTTKLRLGENNLTQVEEEENKPQHSEMETPLDGFGEKLPEDNMTVNFNKLPFNVKDHHGNESEENKIPVEETPKLTVPSSKESSIPVLHRFIRFPLKKEKEKQSRAGMPLKTIREQIRRKEKLSSKEVEKKQSLEEPEQSQTTKLRLGENNLTQVEEQKNKPQHSEMEIPVEEIAEKLPEDNMTVNFNKLPFDVEDHHGNEIEENKIPVEETPKLTVPSSKESSIPVLHRFIRFPLKKEKEKQSRAGMPLKTIREQIRRKEKLSSKEVEKKQSLEVAEQSQTTKLRLGENNLTQVEEQKNKPQHSEMEIPVEEIAEKLPEDNMTVNFNKLPFDVEDHHGNEIEENKIPVEVTPKMTLSSSKESSIPVLHRFLWFPLKKEEKKQSKAGMPLKTIREQIRRKEKLSSKEVEKKQSLEVAEQSRAREPRQGGNNLTQVEEQKNKPQHNEMETLVEEIAEKLPEDKMTVNFNKLSFNVKDHYGNESEENKIPVKETQQMTVPSSKESSIPVHHRFMWFPLKKEEEKQSKAGMPLKTIREQIGRKEKLSSKDVRKKQSLEVAEQSRAREPGPGGHNLKQVEEQKKKPPHCEIQIPEEEFGENLTEDKMSVKVNELAFNVKNHQCNKSEENKIPGEEIPKMTISSSKESSVSGQHFLKWFPLGKKKEKQPKAGMFFKTIREHLRRKEKLYSEGVEMKQSYQLTVQSLDREPRPGGNNLKQVEEQKNKPQHNEMETLVEEIGEKLPEDKMTEKVNKWAFNVKSLQSNKSEENKIPGEEIPKMIVSSSNGSSVPLHHQSMWFPLEKEEEKQLKADMPLKTIREQIRRKEKLSSKDVERKRSLEPPIEAWAIEPRSGGNNLTQEEEQNKPRQNEMETLVEYIGKTLPEDEMTVKDNELEFNVWNHHSNKREENKITETKTPKMTVSYSKQSSIPVYHQSVFFQMRKEKEKQLRKGMTFKEIREQRKRREKLHKRYIEALQSWDVAEKSWSREPKPRGNNLTQNLRTVEKTPKMTISSSKKSSISEYHRFMWFLLRKEEKKQPKAGVPLKTSREQIRRKEKLSSKEMEKKQSLEVAEQSQTREPRPGGNNLTQVEEQKNKPQHSEMETPLEGFGEKLPEDKMTVNFNKLPSNKKDHHGNKSEENKIPAEKTPKLTVPSSKESSIPVLHRFMRFPLKKEKEKQSKASMPLKTIREQIKRKGSSKEVVKKQSWETKQSWTRELRPGENNLTQVEEEENKAQHSEMETPVDGFGEKLPEDNMTVNCNKLPFNVKDHHGNESEENKIPVEETPKLTVPSSKESSIPVLHHFIRFPLKKEKEKQSKAGMPLKTIREQIRRKEKLSSKEVEKKQSLEVPEQSQTTKLRLGENNLTQVEEEENKAQHSEMETPVDGFGEKLPEDNMTVNCNKLPFNVKDHHGNESEENKIPVEETPKLTVPSSKESSIPVLHHFIRFPLKKEKEKQSKAGMPLKTIREQIRRKEKLSSKEVEKKQSLEVPEQSQTTKLRLGENNLTQVEEQKNKPQHSEMEIPVEEIAEKLPEDNMTVNFNKLPFDVEDHHGNEIEENKIPVEVPPKMTLSSSKESSIPVLHRFLWFPLKKEEKKQSKAGMPLKTIRQQIGRKEKLSSKEVEKKQSLEVAEQSRAREPRQGGNNLTQVEEQKNKPQHNEMETLVEEIAEKLPEDKMTVNFNKLSFNVKDHYGNESEENKIPVKETQQMTVPSSKEFLIPVHHRFMWFPLKKEEEKQPKAGMPLKTIREQIGRKEKLSSKDVRKKQSLEVAEQSWAREPGPGGHNLKQVEEQKKKPPHCEIQIPEEEFGENLTEDKMSVKVNELAFNVKNHQCNKSEENKIPGEEIPKMTISSSKESSVSGQHFLKWFPLGKKKEKQPKAGMFFKTIREHLRRKEKLYSEGVEMKQSYQLTVQSLDREPRPGGNNLKQIDEERYETLGQNDRALQDGLLSNHLRKQNEIEATALEVNQMCEIPDYHEKEKPVLQKNNLLLDEIGVFLLAGDTGKIEKREKESRHIKENEVSKEKIDELQKKLKLSEETLRTKLSEANKQLNFLMIKNRKLTSKWKKEKQKRARVGKDKQSCHLCSAIPDPKQCQTSKQDLAYAFQQERDEWLRIKDQLNYDLSRERDRNDFLAQQLEEADSEVNSLQNQLIHLHCSYREKALILESTERALHQAQFHIKELKRINNIQNEKQHEYTAKEECFQGKLAEIHSENMVLQQQLENAPERVIIKKKVVKDVQVNFSDPFAKVHADREKQVLLVEERNKELIDDCNHSREQGCTYEKEQKEREGTIKELQQQLADALKRQSTLEVFLEVIFCYIHDLEDKKQQLQKETEEIKSKLRESEGRHPKAEPWTNDLEDGEQKLEMENGRLEATAKELLGKMEEMEENLLDPKWLDPERGKGKTLVELKQSLVASLDDQRKRNEEVEQDIGRPRKKKLEEDDKGDLASQEALKQACSQVEDAQMNTLRNQTQAAFQNNTEQLGENHQAPRGNEMEWRMKYMEAELSTLRSSYQDAEEQLERNTQLYFKELKANESLSKELDRANRRLLKVSAKLRNERQRNETLRASFTASPVLEPPPTEPPNSSSLLNGGLIPRGNRTCFEQ
ncbi:titin homolog isoform X2 [Monodelphis domestica]|uniref:titin homolog isoform X2 n=1 Tax=Monodelphis domestica TaxID=13616 RepID=UPI0024E201D3|nr:titin homolog isoform X2 [Monodelphis domestica]